MRSHTTLRLFTALGRIPGIVEALPLLISARFPKPQLAQSLHTSKTPLHLLPALLLTVPRALLCKCAEGQWLFQGTPLPG